ncbi:MAG: 50S ribosomal protein L2 [Candidatus Magasanikbacteria bacterium RIFOXYC2_FULL_40_16]|uniref:Large ribosomal subunit protein uL2 n=3 Tax=Candidatus Magasanikiibacteriota TaxID=1752731 RepID=A0A1F6NH68_9BACT|nr:MAG: 50S ribosomal protein L2 [Candidatus Magasanikbacteria bacterium RIFOXYA2_FULL_40_20]OGH83219.1 MAG: 50S ribosomal protein L2 [Candidatus Magasanikbacteria bacterium RIFOXYB1_FULL_40_15]OGH85151.1 MAG: 50S ribosomal protein L2 [Candidatus Magasanikbacteria bacterium RIFOXYB2_FULL_40_13]OGH87291.1 MAG: 50S ribosomal protein L2 [Candidatus Magasanikbacteria bacterium RIFOXYA1_FULL_40_8]OGH89502.1 MAG: 50S ribosomal protein L2 [Candidatus Magasanikbacteria bacterium RIFOXYC2_FULL_40_16]
MGIKIYKPTTPGRRKASVQDFSDITKKHPEKSLTVILKKNCGRNNTGRITVRHQGGGSKRLYRIVDFKRQNFDVAGEVIAIEYDPNRGSRIALVLFTDNTKSYIIAAEGMKVGDKVLSSQKKIEAVPGNRMPLKYIPVGLFIYNIELTPGKGGQIVKGAGTASQLQVFEAGMAQLKLPSGEIRMVSEDCAATVGRISNPDFKLVRLGKAGRMRHKGIRPTVKGKNMNPVDHPHGGGEGHSPIGLKGGPKTPWGKKALGVKTRQRGKWSDKFIVKRRRGKNN